MAGVSDPSLSLSPKQAAGLTAKFILFQLGLFVGIGIIQGVTGAIMPQPALKSATATPLMVILVNSTAAALVLHAQLRRSKITWSQLADWGIQSLPFLPVFLLLMVGEVIVISEVDNRMSAVLPPPQWIVAYASEMTDLANHPISVPFALVVMAAVTEEFLFRGLILRGLLARVGPGRAVVISAGLFAVMHLNPWQMPATFLIGAILGWVYWRTRSLTLCIVGHAFHNALVLLAPGLFFAIDGFSRGQQPGHILFQPWWFNLLGLVVLATGVLLFHHKAPRFNWTLPGRLDEPPPLPLSSG